MKALTIVDKATGWPEVVGITNKQSENIAKLFDQVWLCRYPKPRRVIYDNGSEFIGFEFQEMLHSFGIEPVPTTVKNPQANSPVERMHLTMGDMLRTSPALQGHGWAQELGRMLQSVCWALHSTVNSTTKHTSGQLAFNRDMLTQARISVDWDRVTRTRREKAVLVNEQENSSRKEHVYQEGDQVLVRLEGSD